MLTTRLSQRLAAFHKEAPPKESLAPTFEIGIATDPETRLEAAGLVGRLYRAEGYLPVLAEPDAADAPFYTLHHMLPESTVFVAWEDGRVVGTLTAVLDSAAGLPLEGLYPEEIAAQRGKGRRLCEICSLAIDPRRPGSDSQLFLSLFKEVTSYLMYCTAVTDVLVTLKPSHEDFYTRRLGFGTLGSWKQDERFGNADTIALRLSRERVEELRSGLADAARTNRIVAFVFGMPSQESLDRFERMPAWPREAVGHGSTSLASLAGRPGAYPGRREQVRGSPGTAGPSGHT